MPAGDHTQALDNAFTALEDLRNFIELAQSGLGFSTNAREMKSLLHQIKHGKSEQSERFKSDKRLEKLENFSISQMKRGFPYVTLLAVTRLCSILEVAVSDYAKEVMTFEDSIRMLPAFTAVNGPVIEFSQYQIDEKIDFLLHEATEKIGAKFKKGVGRFESTLNLIGLGGSVDESVSKCLLEMIEVRNLIVHRNARIDKRFLAACPWFGGGLGEDLIVSDEKYRTYDASVLWYLFEILLRETIRFPKADSENHASPELIKEIQSRCVSSIGLFKPA